MMPIVVAPANAAMAAKAHSAVVATSIASLTPWVSSETPMVLNRSSPKIFRAARMTSGTPASPSRAADPQQGVDEAADLVLVPIVERRRRDEHATSRPRDAEVQRPAHDADHSEPHHGPVGLPDFLALRAEVGLTG